MMEADQGEEEMLRSVALQNAKSILVARQRAEQELIESKQALEQKTEELTRANRRLTLLTRVANNLMLADMPRATSEGDVRHGSGGDRSQLLFQLQF